MFENKLIVVTGGAGFIGSNLCDAFLKTNNKVRCLDNFSTGRKANMEPFRDDPGFIFLQGDIRNPDDCRKAVEGADFVLHQAALGSVPRSISNPVETNSVNIGGFLNMLVAARDAGVKRFVYATSSSTYGDSVAVPKVEDVIGKPQSPYAITKYVNELYADVFHKTFGIDCIGLRYFNVFGRNQDPEGAYAAVIPKFVMQLMKHESPVINGNGEFTRDFTYIDNVIQANMLALSTTDEKALNTVYNIAYGEKVSLNEMFSCLKKYLIELDPEIAGIEPVYGPERKLDIPHSHASVEKAKKMLGYKPEFSLQQGLKEAVKWYWENLK